MKKVILIAALVTGLTNIGKAQEIVKEKQTKAPKKETKEVKETKESKEVKETKDVKETKETKEVKDTKAPKEKEVKGEKEKQEMKTPEERAQKSVDHLNKAVGLSEEQKTKIYDLALNRAKSVDAIKEKYRGQQGSKETAKNEIIAVKKEYRQGVKAVLTPEQLEKLKSRPMDAGTGQGQAKDKGAKGGKGQKGGKATKGEKGSKGEKGDKGEKGEKGDKGNKEDDDVKSIGDED